MSECSHTMKERPIVAITLGDPAGIGPEIVVRALSSPDTYLEARPLVIGERQILERASAIVESYIPLNEVAHPVEGKYVHGSIDFVDLQNIDLASIKPGEVGAAGGRASFEYIEKSVKMAMEGQIDAIATAPINKESISAAGIPFIGHTEMLTSLAGCQDAITMFQVRNLRIFFLTRHVSLAQACGLITSEAILAAIEGSDDALRRLGSEGRRIAVAGLNPHCGEHGLFGNEEVQQIEPAVHEALKRGYSVDGPVPADSVFHRALRGEFDAVLSLYHDQGHIAAKTQDFERTVSVTIGPPFLRTSVDHGTAFDIAGKGIASSVSMEEAIMWAARYSPHFRQ
mgnify:CR=1 FL=1